MPILKQLLRALSWATDLLLSGKNVLSSPARNTYISESVRLLKWPKFKYPGKPVKTQRRSPKGPRARYYINDHLISLVTLPSRSIPYQFYQIPSQFLSSFFQPFPPPCLIPEKIPLIHGFSVKFQWDHHHAARTRVFPVTDGGNDGGSFQRENRESNKLGKVRRQHSVEARTLALAQWSTLGRRFCFALRNSLPSSWPSFRSLQSCP